MFKKILVALDGSKLAEAILPYVRGLAQCTGAEIVLLRVPAYESLEIAAMETAMIAPTSWPDDEAVRREATAYLKGLVEELKGSGLKATSVVRDGPVANTVVDYASEINADLIALSTHGRSGLARLLMGSVADEIVHDSKAPVLLIRSLT
jgi:nucleotide-binding universal stress UspA family protein